MITGVEWEWKGVDPAPNVRLVAWRHADDTRDGVYRQVLVPVVRVGGPADADEMLTLAPGTKRGRTQGAAVQGPAAGRPMPGRHQADVAVAAACERL